MILSPFNTLHDINSDRYLQKNVEVELVSLNIEDYDHPVFPAKIRYELKMINSGNENISFPLSLYLFSDHSNVDIAFDIIDLVEINIGNNSITGNLLIGKVPLACHLEENGFSNDLRFVYDLQYYKRISNKKGELLIKGEEKEVIWNKLKQLNMKLKEEIECN
ncbi:MAG: hypothetical protein V1859_09175 [archaeon]